MCFLPFLIFPLHHHQILNHHIDFNLFLITQMDSLKLFDFVSQFQLNISHILLHKTSYLGIILIYSTFKYFYRADAKQLQISSISILINVEHKCPPSND